MRSFLAIEPPDSLKRRLEAFRRELPKVKWTPTGQTHLTLTFLGEVEESVVETLKQSLRGASFQPFELAVGDCGFFPDARRPKVFWLGFEPSEPLTALKADVDQCLRGIVETKEREKKFAPHLTLARLKSGCSRDTVRALSDLFREKPKLGRFSVDAFHLFSSELTPNGAIHEREVEFHAD